jgi:phytoene dehydrogenase-like protein
VTRQRYDIVIVGGGLNGLVAAAYLSRSGKSVVVLEQSDVPGGTSATIDIAPGFRGPAAIDSMELFHPSIIADLRLSSHGLTVHQGGGLLLARDDGNPLILDEEFGSSLGASKSVEADQVSAADASAFEELNDFLRKVSRALDPLLTQPLPDTSTKRFAELGRLMQLGWSLRRLGKQDMAEALRFLPMNVKDVLDEHFKDEALKAAFAASALSFGLMAPRSAGTAYALLHRNPHWSGGLVPNLAVADSADHGLPGAIARSAKAAGAELRLKAVVERINVESGRVQGVILADGSVIESATVVSALDPRRTFLDLTGTEWLDPDFVESVTLIRSRGSASIIRLALDKLPTFSGVPNNERSLRGRIQIGNTMDTIERAFDDAKYGRVPENPLLVATIPSVLSPGLAPDGKHVMIVRAQFTASELRSSNWNADREAFADKVVGMLDRVAPGLKSSILHRQIETPPDLERRFGITGGCLDHVDIALDQLLYLRPIPGWSDYKTPIEGLYLCGPGVHPGGAGTGLSGKCASMRILKDLARS